MNSNHPDLIQYVKNSKPINGILLRVWEVMTKKGELKGLSDDQALERVVSVTEKIAEEAKKQ